MMLGALLFLMPSTMAYMPLTSTRSMARSSSMTMTAANPVLAQMRAAQEQMRSRRSTLQTISELYSSNDVQAVLDAHSRSKQPDPVVVFYVSKYCKACHRFMPKLNALAAHVPSVRWHKIYHNDTTNPAFKEAGIRQLPSFALHRGGRTQLIPLTVSSLGWLETTLQGYDI
jgi:thiol-disulfide isomerase/thioredoxin